MIAVHRLPRNPNARARCSAAGWHWSARYLSFETDQRPQRLHDAFPGRTLTRLRELKAVYDPQNVFNQNFPVDPVL
jgi:hypothetical protein